MTKEQDGVQIMSKLVLGLLTNNTALTSSIPNFPALLTPVQPWLTSLYALTAKQISDKSGEFLSKAKLKKLIIAQILDLASRVHYYADTVNNTTLAAIVDITETFHTNLSESEFIAFCQNIKDTANANLAALATYGVTTALLTSIQTNITAYANQANQNRLSKLEGSASTDTVASLTASLKQQWKKIDIAVKLVRLSQPAFYKEYLSARKIPKTAASKRALTVNATEEGKGLPNVSLLMAPSETLMKSVANISSKTVTKKTSKKGGSVYQNLPNGEYTLTAKKLGYKDVTQTINIVAGETLKLEIKMLKADTNAIMIG